MTRTQLQVPDGLSLSDLHNYLANAGYRQSSEFPLFSGALYGFTNRQLAGSNGLPDHVSVKVTKDGTYRVTTRWFEDDIEADEEPHDYRECGCSSCCENRRWDIETAKWEERTGR